MLTNYQDALEAAKTRPQVVIFTADWCAPCKQLKPALRMLKADYGFDLHEIDVGSLAPAELETLGVRNVPNVRVLWGDAVKAQFAGARTPRQIEDWLEACGVVSKGLSFE